ncbi:MAG: ATP-binding cassette domain-containing protein [Armatimonadota bacterium]|nr:ATP-binding cassette domain-containing protein [Armatimonadota bacterium]MDR7438380.1 ATP-binding cassette domain-containing protein [Armatimonadota bacterium]MDR7563354.1 ATP-binding cassette domain-containing protein [Armatimonadota bacterium]MDR7568575.1 ATP-binding cassette domain-containing protein [Armatimonadota bacterium]
MPLLRARGISKRFGAVQALREVDVDLYPAEVLGLVGDNGAGKSTLIKILSGVYPPDAGTLELEGRPVRFASPREARAAGIETIYQDLALAENLDVAGNIFLGRELGYGWGLLRVLARRPMEEAASQVLQRLEIHLPSVRTLVRHLSGGQRQAVAISRAVYWDARIVIMDEPTAALGVRERARVLELVRRLREQGKSVIVISHSLPDIFAVCDRIVVLRRGVKVGERRTGETTEEEIVRMMVGVEAA